METKLGLGNPHYFLQLSNFIITNTANLRALGMCVCQSTLNDLQKL